MSAVRLALAIVAVAALGGTARAGLDQVSDFGANPGALDMYEHAPAELAPGRPIVVVLHGCTQTAAQIEVAGWDALADAHGFDVIYPQQRTANQPLGCFTWYEPGDITRGQGEAASIVAMVDHATAAHGSDPTRVYVTGLSAGGAFTAVLLAAYPDRFAAGSVMSGLPYGCAMDLTSATQCEQGMTKTAAAWGDLVRAADPGFAGPWPRVQVWQGDHDTTVAPANAGALVAQWTNVRGVDQTATATDVFGPATRTRYGDDVEAYVVAGMGHAIATGSDSLGPCPSGTGMYFEDHQVCATLRAADFFGLLDDGGGSGGSGAGSDAAMGHGGCAAGGGGVSPILALALLFGPRSGGRRRRRGPGFLHRMPSAAR